MPLVAGKIPSPKARTAVRAFLFVAELTLLLPLSLACHQIPEGRTAIESVTISGTSGREEKEIRDGIATREPARLLGVLPTGFVYDYELFDEATLERDLARVERQLRRRGYYEAKVRAARVIVEGEDRVKVEIEVDKGPLVLVRKVETNGLSGLPFDAASRALEVNPLRAGDPFDEDVYEEAESDVSNALADYGYAYVRTQGTAKVDLAEHAAIVTLTVSPGPRAVYGDIKIEGLEELPEGPIRRTLGLRPGARYSRKDLEQARAALFDLGVFSKVEVIPDLKDPSVTEIPISVRVTEAPQRSVTAGVGATLDVLRLGVNGRLGWTHRNFLGGLRELSVSTRPGLTFFPTRITNWEDWNAPTAIFAENALLISLEQPSFLEGRTRGFVDVGYNVYPLLYPLADSSSPESERVIGYNELTFSLGVRRTFFSRLMPTSLSMNWRSNFPFTYQGYLSDICDSDDPGDHCGLDDVLVAYPELLTDFDLRDDPISPTKGLFLSNSLQVAIPALGGQLEDIRIRPEARFFVPLDYGRRLILASRATVGFVFPQNYGTALQGAVADPTSVDVVRDQHRLLFRAFYSGGPQSNRGYPYQRIGPQGPIGFLLPENQRCTGALDAQPTECLRPLGGFSLWEASVELRYRIAGPWGAVLFVDASNVTEELFTFDFMAPHISVGPGLRYQSPVGPIRVDLGMRVPGLQRLGDTDSDFPDISEIAPYNSQNWYDGLVLHVLIGEAY
ncbi:MAG: hypothetical protein B6A08_02025 [Sorangiineae bacterium NIC37A_2]|nr:MAG: hypothetical protein B6A08_02025 [Sorangiineae bacterium NIC37A_2]